MGCFTFSTLTYVWHHGLVTICQCSLFTQAPALSTAKAPIFPSSPPRSVRAPGQAASQTTPRIPSPWASLLHQTALWGSTTCTSLWWLPLASVGPERTTAETSTSSSTPGHQVGLGSLIRNSFFEKCHRTFICMNSTCLAVVPQLMPSFWMMRLRGRSAWWMRWGSSTTVHMTTSLKETGTTDR